MLKVYCYSKCSTCKKALKWLDENKIKHEVVDIKANHPDEEMLRKYYAMSGLTLKRFFNTSGMQYRELELSKKLPDMSEDEQFRLLPEPVLGWVEERKVSQFVDAGLQQHVA